jgi:mannan endo-1,4-beta-mannosidase
MNPNRKKKTALLIHTACLITLCATSSQAAISITYGIDTTKNQRPISPYIYGMNLAGVNATNLTVRRLGGNRLTSYNWENNFSNAGKDWKELSDEYLSSSIPADIRQTPGKVVTDFVDDNRSAGMESLVTLQMAGYVAADKDGPVSVEEAAPSHRWKKVEFKKNAPFCNPPGKPDLNDGVVYMDELVNFLVSRYGNASKGGVKFYATDNEAALWSETHSRMRSEQTTCEEVIELTRRLSGAVKDVDPFAEILGPSFYGYGALHNFQGAPDWEALKEKYAYSWFVDYYLDALNKASIADGKRLLDVLDTHWYPEAQDGDGVRIIEFRPTATNAEVRLQTPRSLWDAEYLETSWISQYIEGAFPFLPRLFKSIDTYFPGTKLAITEYCFGGESDISGGIAQADVLGIYGKYDVYISTYWGDGGDYLDAAFNLYRNYDGKKATFGDTHVQAEMSDKVNSSIFAALHSENDRQISLIVLNKNATESIQGSFNINSPRLATSGRVWAFDAKTTEITEREPIGQICKNRFQYTIPPLTACHIVLQLK